MPTGVYTRHPKQYPGRLVALVRQLYKAGKTQAEVAAAIGTTQKVVWRLMVRHGIKARVAKKRNQRREANASWKGDAACYQAMHRRLDALFGRPKHCDICGTSDAARSYDWASLTKRYPDPTDFKRMCRSCHWKYDHKHLNFKGATGNRPARKEGA